MATFPRNITLQNQKVYELNNPVVSNQAMRRVFQEEPESEEYPYVPFEEVVDRELQRYNPTSSPDPFIKKEIKGPVDEVGYNPLALFTRKT